MVFVEVYFKTIADFLVLHQKKTGSWADTVKFYDKSGLKKTFTEMHSKILEDNLFIDIAHELDERYPSKPSKIVVPLLD